GNPPPPPPPPPPTGEGTGKSLYSGTVPMATKRNADGTYTLSDDSRNGSRTLDLRGGSSGAVAINDNNNTWGATGDPANQKAAIDAHYGARNTWDFYKNFLGRNSIDGNGEALISNVHLNRNYNNAYWDGTQMNYGDGDGTTFTPLTTLDIAGHEI